MADTGDAISADINLLIEVLTQPVPLTGPGEYYELDPSRMEPMEDPWRMPIIQ